MGEGVTPPLKVAVLPSFRKELLICFTGRVHFEQSFCISTYFSILITQFWFGKIFRLQPDLPFTCFYVDSSDLCSFRGQNRTIRLHWTYLTDTISEITVTEMTLL